MKTIRNMKIIKSCLTMKLGAEKALADKNQLTVARTDLANGKASLEASSSKQRTDCTGTNFLVYD